MDEIKRFIAAAIQTKIVNIEFMRNMQEAVRHIDQDVSDVDTASVNSLTSRIRVQTPGGPRYFSVTVKEEL